MKFWIVNGNPIFPKIYAKLASLPNFYLSLTCTLFQGAGWVYNQRNSKEALDFVWLMATYYLPLTLSIQESQSKWFDDSSRT